MGRQVNFFLHPDDQADFDFFLKKTGDIVFIPYFHSTNKLTVIDNPVMNDCITRESRVYLARKKDLPLIGLHYMEAQKHWLVNSDAPVLHFDRCILRENAIDCGRLYFQTSYLKDMRWAFKPDESIKWADTIIRATRRKLNKYTYERGKYTYSALLGNAALEWLKNNDANVSNTGTSIIKKIKHEQYTGQADKDHQNIQRPA